MNSVLVVTRARPTDFTETAGSPWTRGGLCPESKGDSTADKQRGSAKTQRWCWTMQAERVHFWEHE